MSDEPEKKEPAQDASAPRAEAEGKDAPEAIRSAAGDAGRKAEEQAREAPRAGASEAPDAARSRGAAAAAAGSVPPPAGEEIAPPPPSESGVRRDALERVSRLALLAIPLVGVLELGLHLWQVSWRIDDASWAEVKASLEKVPADDLVAVAPGWLDPVAREKLGGDVLTLARVGRPDETRFPRAHEVSIGGEHLPAFAGWAVERRSSFGKLDVTTYVNPHPARIIEDLVDLVGPARLEVARVDGGVEQACTFGRYASQSGNIGFGMAVPAMRFHCAGGWVGATVMPDLAYAPRRCIGAPPFGGPTLLRLRFRGVRFGRALHGHHGIAVHQERDLSGAPVVLVARTEQGQLGRVVHNDGDGWKTFELDTRELEGKAADLVFEISAQSAANRQYCFEADTR